MNQFKRLYAAGRVKRYHTCDVPAQELGQHSWGVAMIVATIYPRDVEVPSRLLLAALTHDLAESETGDVPATAKWGDKKLSRALERLEDKFNEEHAIMFELTAPEKRILQWADTFELIMYCLHQNVMGNSYALDIVKRGAQYIMENLKFPTTESKELFDEFFN
jgi:5'-deoxynucleotidase YfbR-like HD superfamily hydrolase